MIAGFLPERELFGTVIALCRACRVAFVLLVACALNAAGVGMLMSAGLWLGQPAPSFGGMPTDPANESDERESNDPATSVSTSPNRRLYHSESSRLRTLHDSALVRAEICSSLFPQVHYAAAPVRELDKRNGVGTPLRT